MEEEEEEEEEEGDREEEEGEKEDEGRRRKRRAMGGWKEGTAGAAPAWPRHTRMQKLDLIKIEKFLGDFVF